MTRTFKQGLHRVGLFDHQRAIASTDRAVSQVVLEKYGDQLCCTCTGGQQFVCGPFRRRECMPTRFHPFNLSKQCQRCNRFEGGRSYEFSQWIDWTFGIGTAVFLEQLSRTIEPWTTEELGTLKDAARRGWQVYEATYFMLRPHHHPDVAGLRKTATAA